jgi:hypothetical protein
MTIAPNKKKMTMNGSRKDEKEEDKKYDEEDLREEELQTLYIQYNIHRAK